MDLRELNFYHMYALGFCGAEKQNNLESGVAHRLREVTAFVPKIKALGCNALYIGPVFEAESHGYDTVDYYKVDRRLGDEADLKALVERCHREGILVVLDCVFNHVSRSHFAFQDLLSQREHSKYKEWFKGVDFSQRSPKGDAFTYETWDGHWDLVKLNLQNEAVRRELIAIAQYWMDTFDIDGLRMDAANVMDRDFLRQLSQACKAKKSEFVIIGEIVGGDYRELAQGGMLDGITNYECYKGMYSSLNDANYFEIAHSLNRQFGSSGLLNGCGSYNFVDNHDVNRVASELKKDGHLYPLYVMLYTMPGTPSVYYLSEIGQRGLRTAWSDEALRSPYVGSTYEQGHPLQAVIGRLAGIRRESKALKYGDYSQLTVAAQQFACKRSCDGEDVIVVLNASDSEAVLKLPNGCKGKYWDLLNHVEIIVDGSIGIDPNWGRILKRV